MSEPSPSKRNEIFAWPANELLAVARNVQESNNALEKAINTDLVTLASLINTGRKIPQQIKLLGLFGKAYVKRIRGEDYLIFKGYAGLRPNLRGTKYLKSNVLVKTLVVGAEDIVKDARGGFLLSFVCYTIIDIIKELSSDHPSLLALGVDLSMDLLKCAVSTAAGAVAGVGLVFLLPGTPVVVAFVTVMTIGAVVGYILDVGDQKYKLTSRVKKKIEHYSNNSQIEFKKIGNDRDKSASFLMRTGSRDTGKIYISAVAMLHDVA